MPILHGIILKSSPKTAGPQLPDDLGHPRWSHSQYYGGPNPRVGRHFARKYPERDLHFYTAMTYGNPSLRAIMTLAESEGLQRVSDHPALSSVRGRNHRRCFR